MVPGRAPLARFSGADLISLDAIGAISGDQRVDKIVEITLEDLRQLLQRHADPVIGHAILREVVRADLLRAVAGAHGLPALGGDLLALRTLGALEQSRAED